MDSNSLTVHCIKGLEQFDKTSNPQTATVKKNLTSMDSKSLTQYHVRAEAEKVQCNNTSMDNNSLT